MKLTDLNPRWVGAGGEGILNADMSPAPERHGVGIRFGCPCSQEVDPHPDCYIPFENPLDGGPPLPDDRPRWHREGETFEALTLTPSILISGCCKWHGFITNGDVIGA